MVAAEELSGGDFVRTMKQLIDLLRQFAIVAPLKETRRAADAAAEALFRGVVASSSAVDVEDAEIEVANAAALVAAAVLEGAAVNGAETDES